MALYPPHLTSLLQACPTVETTSDAPHYFPLENGRYEIKPGMLPLETDLGNGAIDRQVFQFDRNREHYYRIKQAARAECLEKYYQTCNYTDTVACAVTHFIVERLTHEHPQTFHAIAQPNGGCSLHNRFTQETLHFDADWQLQPDKQQQTPYVSALDALATQVQEDLVVVSRDQKKHWVSAIHLCFPNYWAATDKIGQDFATVHAPVAGMEKLNQRGPALTHTMIAHRPTVRFGWGLTTDTRLNHHPDAPPGIPLSEWQGRQFNPQTPRLYVRVERQVIWGFAAVNAALFAIRTYFWDCAILRQQIARRSQLQAAIASMTPATLAYKGLANSKTAIMTWLTSG